MSPRRSNGRLGPNLGLIAILRMAAIRAKTGMGPTELPVISQLWAGRMSGP
jgi:hypothetical protein